MTTVEAMAGGCVPVVIDRAGQKEIVRPGVDGFRWSTPAELLDADGAGRRPDEALRARLAAAAQDRAQALLRRGLRRALGGDRRAPLACSAEGG